MKNTPNNHSISNHRVFPILTFVFLFSFLDRTNVGNARIIGLDHESAVINQQYRQGPTVFYAACIAIELPFNSYLRTLTPRVALPLLAAICDVITISLRFVRSFAGVVALRDLLGLCRG